MKEQFDNVIEWIKTQDIDGCITGSCLLEYFEGADVDVFTYNEAAFTKLIYAMYYNPMFTILDPLEKWKFTDWTETANKGSLKKLGLVSLKFTYNTCIEVNVIFKEKNNSVFDVISSFDMNIVCKGIDLKTKQVLDLTGGLTKIATWNKYNKAFYKTNIWSVSRILRQLLRCVKYHRRSYNTDDIVLKYKELLEDVMQQDSIFSSEKVDEKTTAVRTNGKLLIQIMDKWLETHTMTKEEEVLIMETVRRI